MKKKIYLIAVTMLLSIAALSSRAAGLNENTRFSKEAIANMSVEERQARIEEIKVRVNEIKEMDKSQLTKEDRKELRTELKSIKANANAMSGGIYLSVGAIIIIILVLILIL